MWVTCTRDRTRSGGTDPLFDVTASSNLFKAVGWAWALNLNARFATFAQDKTSECEDVDAILMW